MIPGVSRELVSRDISARIPSSGDVAFTLKDGRVWFVSHGAGDTWGDVLKLIDAAMLERPEGDG